MSNKTIQFAVFNVSGTKILQKNFSGTSTEIDIKSLSDGIYFYSIILGNDESISGKFVKK